MNDDYLIGDGTRLSGYVLPEDGPFMCDNCVHFDGRRLCGHPVVIADPEVRGVVKAESCCNFYRQDRG